MRAAAAGLASLPVELDAREDLREVALLSSFDVVLADYDLLTDDERGRIRRAFGATQASHLVLVVGTEKQAELAGLLEAGRLSAFIAKNQGELDANDLQATLAKLTTKVTFGLEPYVMWGLDPRRFEVGSKGGHQAALEEVKAYVTSKGLHPRFVNMARQLVDEFAASRLLWPSADGVTLQLGFDGRTLAVMASDKAGVTQLRELLPAVATAVRKEGAGAAAGSPSAAVAQIFGALSHWVVNVAPGQRTESLGLISVRSTYRNFVAQRKSFSCFSANGA